MVPAQPEWWKLHTLTVQDTHACQNVIKQNSTTLWTNAQFTLKTSTEHALDYETVLNTDGGLLYNAVLQ